MRCTVVITAEQRDRLAGTTTGEEYIRRRFRQDYGLEIGGTHDPRLEFEEAEDGSAVRITFDDRRPVLYRPGREEDSVELTRLEQPAGRREWVG